jgi:hypothetical protein
MQAPQQSFSRIIFVALLSIRWNQQAALIDLHRR